jgi:hypothetical protein
MKFVFLICSLLIHLNVYAVDLPLVQVFTSLTEIKTVNRLDKIIKQRINKDQYHLEVYHQADALTLWQAMQKNPKAIIWLSHGGGGFSGGNGSLGIVAPSVLLDYQQKNVAAIFTALPKSVEYLAIIGCYASNLLEYYEIPTTQLQEVYLPTKKVVATFGMKRAIKRLKMIGFKNTTVDSPIEQKKHVRLVINNNSLKPLTTLKIVADKKVYAFIAPLAANESYELNLDFPLGVKSFRIESDYSLETPINEIYMGDIQVDGWRAFTKPDGSPFGHNQLVFRIKT